MVVKVANWAWIEGLDEDAKRHLVKRLTVYPRGIPDIDPNPSPIAAYVEKDGWFGVPREFYYRYLRDYENVSCEWVEGEKINIKSVIVLRPEQEEFFAGLRSGIQGRGGIIVAPAGYGKTIIGIRLVEEIQRKTLVVTHRECLLKQWEEKILKFTNARVGFAYAGILDYRDADIVIGLVQSLATKCYPEDFYRSFGVVISDEVHHLSSRVWSNVIVKFPARWRFGLTATVHRRDNTECIFSWHIGQILGKTNLESMIPKIRIVNTGWRCVRTPTWNPSYKRSLLVRIMIKDMRRNRLIIDEVMKALVAKRKVLVLSERREHLKILADMFSAVSNGKYKYDFYVGGAGEETLRSANEKNVLFGTFQYAEEGADLVPFSVVFLTTPKVRVYQSIGRILRDCPGKPQPVVTDFVDEEAMFREFARMRVNLYRQKGWV